MPSPSDIRAGGAFVELYSESSAVEQALKRVEAKFKALGTVIADWGKQMMLAGAAVTAPLIAVAKLAGTMGDELNNMSKRTGISVEALSELDYVASQTGTSIDDLETSVKKMQKSLEDASHGSKEMTDALTALGLNIKDLQGLSPDEQLKRIARAMADVKSPAERAALAMQIFGKSGTQLLPMMMEGSAGIDALIKRAHELGIVMSTADAQAANAFNDKLSELWKVIRKAGFDIGSILLPALTTIANTIERVITVGISWIRSNREIVVWTLLIGSAVFTAGAALFVFGKAIVFAVAVAQGLQAAMAALWGVISAVGGLIATVFTSPLLLSIAVVLGLAAAVVYLSGTAGKALAWLGDRFSELQGTVSDVFKGIADAMIAGDLVLATKIMWVGIETVWREGVNALHQIWLPVKRFFLEVFQGAVSGAQAVWEGLQSDLASGWINTISGLKVAWTAFSSWYQTAVNDLSAFLAVHLFGADQADIGKMQDDQQRQIDAQRDASLKGIEAERAAALKANQEQNDAEMIRIGKEYDEELARIKDEGAAASADDKAKLKDLQDQLDALMKQAAEKRRSKDAGLAAGNGPGVPDFIPAILAAQSSAFGSFSGAAARAAGGGGSSPILKHVADTASNTKFIKEGIDTLNRNVQKFDGATFT